MCFDHTFQFAEWSIPCQLDKFCCCQKKTNDDHNIYANFKPDTNIKNVKAKLITDYLKLSNGTYNTNTRNVLQTLLFILYLCLLFPFFLISITFALGFYSISSLYQIIIGFIRLYFCCNFLCCREYVYHGNVTKKVDNWSFMTFVSSEIDERRFAFYKQPIYLCSFSWNIYLRTCQYLAGLFTAKLISDDMIIYFVHLWSTTKSHFVYDYDPETKKPIRIRGIIDDYSSWSSNESVAEFWENTTFEILSVFIDYDDKCRITFNLRNGDKIMEPRFDTAWNDDIHSLTDEQLNELRIWNIHKAHYQCLISIYPALIHTWAHFHFNDLVLRYIETYWNDNPYDDDAKQKKSFMNHSVLNQIIRSHTYYTSSLNAAGHNDGFVNPQMNEWNWCEFLCAPWKALPGNADVLRRHFVQDITAHYFCDIERNDDENAVVDLVVNGSSPSTQPELDCMQVAGDEPQSESAKTANLDAFPPKFVQNRLKMFQLDLSNTDEMHRGYSIYKDYLADYYECIHRQFVLPLYNGGFITDQDLTTFVNHLEKEGFPGLLKCKRNGGYLHIFTTFLWLNVVHSSDHTIANNLIRNIGIGASYVPMYSKQWYDNHKNYNFVDVLEGKTCGSRWRLQFYALKNQMFWSILGGPTENVCFVADYFIDSNLYHRFIDVDHINDLQRNELNRIHGNFIKQLKELDIGYRWLMPVEDITSGIHY